MIENALSNLGGVAIFGLVSICIFFAFFTGMILWAARLKKPYLKAMSGLPLENETDSPAEINPDSGHE